MTLPALMTCIEIPSFGGPEALQPGQRPLPQIKTGEVLIKVEAAGINRPDVIQRQGSYPPPPGASDIPGLEVAGTIAAIADGVEGLRVGDAVTALLTGGGYAQYAATPAALCLPIPAGYDMIKAAALPETFFTVWHNVFQRARLQPGTSLPEIDPFSDQDSARLLLLAEADALLVRPAHDPARKAGEQVSFLAL